MHAGRKALFLGETPEQCEQLGALVVIEGCGDCEFVLAGDAGQLGEYPPAVIGQRDRIVAAIVRVAVARDEAPVLELVDQGDESRGVHPQRIGELTLALSRELPEAAEHSGLGRREPKRKDALGEGRGRVRPKLGQQEGDPPVAPRLPVVSKRRSHHAKDYKQNVMHTINNRY